MTRATFTVTAVITRENLQSYVLHDGAMREVIDPFTGVVTDCLVMVAVPKSQVMIVREWKGSRGERMAEIEMPEWLAKEKELV